MTYNLHASMEIYSSIIQRKIVRLFGARRAAYEFVREMLFASLVSAAIAAK
jgi:hypothetical protein